MSTRDHRKNHSQQARSRAGVILRAILFVLMLLVAPIFVLGSGKQVHSAEAAGTENAALWLDGPGQATRGGTISYDVKTDAAGLFGVQLELAFDPAILQVVNAQLTPGNCPAPDFIVTNAVDNNAGKISYAASSLAPTQPCAGGTVASLQFQVSQTAALGNSIVQFDNVIMADKDGTEIPLTAVDLTLLVSEQQNLYLPVILAD